MLSARSWRPRRNTDTETAAALSQRLLYGVELEPEWTTEGTCVAPVPLKGQRGGGHSHKTRTELAYLFGNGALYFKNKRQSRPRAALATHSRFSKMNCALDVGGRSSSSSLWHGEPYGETSIKAIGPSRAAYGAA